MKLGHINYSFFCRVLTVFAGICLLFCNYKTTALNNSIGEKTIIHFSKASEGKINVQIITEQSKKVALYLFAANGELIKKLDTNTKLINVVSGIDEGQYLYQCFENDTQLKSGKLMVKANNISYD